MNRGEVTPSGIKCIRLTIQTENTTSITSPHTNTQYSKAKKPIFLTTAATQQKLPQNPTQSLQHT